MIFSKTCVIWNLNNVESDNDIKTYKNALHKIKRLEMVALDQNNENELLESILNLRNLVENKMASQITKQNIG